MVGRWRQRRADGEGGRHGEISLPNEICVTITCNSHLGRNLMSSTFLLAPNVVKSCLDPTYDASENGLYDTDSDCYACISGCMAAQGGVDAWVLDCE